MRKEFKKGDIVWAQAINQPTWPAQVIFVMPESLYQVVFFNDNSRAVLRTSMMFDFLKYKPRFEKSIKLKNFRVAVKEANSKAISLRDEGRQAPREYSKDRSRYRNPEPTPSPPPKTKRPYPEPSVSEAARVLSSKVIKKQSAESPVSGKRQRSEGNHHKNFARFQDDQDDESHYEKKGKKKVKRDKPAEPSPEPKVEPPVENKVATEVANKLKTKRLELSIESITDHFKELRRRVDGVVTSIFTGQDLKASKLPPEIIAQLEEILKLLRQSSVKTEDLLVTRTSNSLFFIVKLLGRRQECKTLTTQINKEIGLLEHSLLEQFKSTQKLETELSELRKEQAEEQALAEAEGADYD